MRVYHYRSIERALQEIENGTFHFSSQEELNDPIEGYVKLYWQGDEARMGRAVQNYICSLYRVIDCINWAYHMTGLSSKRLLLININGTTFRLGKIYKKLLVNLWKKPSMQKIIGWLGNQNIRFTEHTLNFLLRLIHETAYTLCIQKMKDRKLVPT